MENNCENKCPTKIFRYRWIILLLYCLYSAVNFFQFLQYSIIANIVSKYYDVDSTLTNLSGLIFMITFIIFCLPVNYLIERNNLRVTSIMSSGLTTCGNLIKLLSVSSDRFYVVLIGQFFCAVGQTFMYSIPSKLASTWFGPDEVSLACGIAIMGTQIGVALGSVFSTNMVRNSENMDAIAQDFWIMLIINASITTACFVVVLLFFRAKPALPPSQSQVDILKNKQMAIWKMIKVMFTNKNYLLLLVCFGNASGIYTFSGIIINKMYLYYFSRYEVALGIITAMVNVMGGCIGSIIFGYILDKWHRFKLTAFVQLIVSALTYVFVVLSLELKQQLATYFTYPLYGFFLGSLFLVSVEFATEIMYPIPEAASCSILNSGIYIFTIIYTYIFQILFDDGRYIEAHVLITSLLLISSVIICFLSPTLRRREANIKNINMYTL